jgi:thiol:disulfide interchange protein DsbD
MTRLFRFFTFITFVLLGFLSGNADENLSSAEVFAAYETVRPGDRLPVAVKLTLADGWHTYAKEPGDFGMPPSFVFSGVEGLDVSEWRFPPPETFTDSVGTSYGYEHEVVLFSDVLIPEAVLQGSTIELNVVMKWMICRDVCVFQKGTQTIAVQSGAVSSGPSAEWTSLLKESGRSNAL